MRNSCKKIAVIVSIILLISAFNGTCFAQNEVSPRIIIDGQEISFDTPPVIDSGRTLVPMRAIFEKLGAELTWIPDTRTVIATKGDIVINAQIDNPDATVGSTKVKLDVPPRIVDNRTLVPLRFIGETLGCQVKWDGATRTVTISTSGGNSAPKADSEPKTAPAANQINQRLIGIWWVKDYSMGMVVVISFNSDGTFKQNVGIYSSISNYAAITKGKYKIEGGNITYYDQTYAQASGYWKNSNRPDYKELGNIFFEGNLPADDKTESISFVDDTHVKLGGLEMARYEQ